MPKAKKDTNVLNSLLNCQDDAVAGLDDLAKITSHVKEAVVNSGKSLWLGKVLVVESPNEIFLPSLTVCLADYHSRFNVLSTDTSAKALKILTSDDQVRLVVIDLSMPAMQGFLLLSHMNREFPAIPVVVMSAHSNPEMVEKMRSLGTIGLLNNPLDLGELPDTIIKGLEEVDCKGTMSDLAFTTFLQLIEIEQKTTLLEVASEDGRKCLCYFVKGAMIDVDCGDLQGEDAALEMIFWNDVEVDIGDISKQKIKKTIKRSLMELVDEVAMADDDFMTAIDDSEK